MALATKSAPERPNPAQHRFTRERFDWLRQVETGHFWHAPRRQLLLRLVEAHLKPEGLALDVGCGSGRLVSTLRSRGYSAYGVDPHAASAETDRDGFTVGQAEHLPYRSGAFDLVSALDLLEHVDDEVALAEIARVLRPGGVLVASVPGYTWLWSERDVRAGHRRRYDRRGLRCLLQRGGFEIQQMRGYQLFLLPLLVASRLWQRLAASERALDQEDRPGPLVNGLLRAVNSSEIALGRWLPIPFGSSLVAVARKRETE